MIEVLEDCLRIDIIDYNVYCDMTTSSKNVNIHFDFSISSTLWNVTCSWTTEIVLFVPDAITDYIVRILRQRWPIVILSTRCVAVSQRFELLKSDIRTEYIDNYNLLSCNDEIYRNHTKIVNMEQLYHDDLCCNESWRLVSRYQIKWQWCGQLVISREIEEEVVK